MDLFPSAPVSDGKLILHHHEFPIPQPIQPLLTNGQQITMGVRRESVKVLPVSHSTAGIQLQAEVEAFESDFVHRTQTVFLRMGRLQFSGLCHLDVKLHLGQPIQAEVNPEDLYFFDTLSGRRL